MRRKETLEGSDSGIAEVDPEETRLAAIELAHREIAANARAWRVNVCAVNGMRQ
jgi:hypothetical protein